MIPFQIVGHQNSRKTTLMVESIMEPTREGITADTAPIPMNWTNPERTPYGTGRLTNGISAALNGTL